MIARHYLIAALGVYHVFLATHLWAADPIAIKPAKMIGSHKGEVTQVVFADGGKTVIGIGSLGVKGTYVRGWDIESRELVWEIPAGHRAALCPDGKAVIDDRNDKFTLLELPSGKEIRSWASGAESLGSFSGEQKFSAQGDLLARRYTLLDQGISVLVGVDIAKGEQRFAHKLDVDMDQFTLLSDDKRAAVMNMAGGLFIYDLETGKRIKTLDEPLPGKVDPRNLAVCSADGKSLIVSTYRGAAEVRSQETLEIFKHLPQVQSAEGRPISPQPVAALPESNLILDSAGSSWWRIWNYDTDQIVAELRAESHLARSHAVSRDGRRLATGDLDGNIYVWDLSPLAKSTPATASTKPRANAKAKAAPAIKIVNRTWTSSDGKFKTRAIVEKVDGETAQLRKEDDSLVTIPLAKLSVADKRYIESVRPQFAPAESDAPGAQEETAIEPAAGSPTEPPKPPPPTQPIANPKAPELSRVPGISIRRSESQSLPFGTRGQGESRLEGQGVEALSTQQKLADAIRMLSKLPKQRIFGVENLPQDLYDIDLKTEKGQWEGATRAFCEALEKSFGVRARLEQRELPALVLRRAPDWEKNGFEKVEEGRGFSGGSDILGRNFTADFRGDMDYLATQLESILQQPVVNETDISGLYATKWRYQRPTAVADTTKFLAEHGLRLEQDKRKIEGIFIEKTMENGKKASDAQAQESKP